MLHKLARELELPKLTFQVIRRTIATLAQKKGTVKDVQGLMRHSRIATTPTCICRRFPRSVQTTVNSIDRELRRALLSLRRAVSVRAASRAGGRRRMSAAEHYSSDGSVLLTPIDTKLERREAITC